MKNVLLKDGLKEIKNTFKRFLSILLVVLLGVGFFAGIKATSPDMKKTLDLYFDNQNVMDIQVISTLGITKKDIESLKNVENVESVQESYAADVIVSVEEEDAVIKLETLNDNMNQPVLIEGRMPQSKEECVVEKSFLTWTGQKIGEKIKVKAEKIVDDEGNKKELLKQKELTVVGTVQSPMYISRERGNTKLGSGMIKYYMFVHSDNINTNISTTAYIHVKNAKELNCSSEEYKQLIKKVKEKLEDIAEQRKQERYQEIYDEAEKKIQEGSKKVETEEKKAQKELNEAQEKIEDAKKQLQIGKQELNNKQNEAQIEFAKAEKQLQTAKVQIKEAQSQYDAGNKQAQTQIKKQKQTLNSLKDTKKQYNTAQNNIDKLEQQIKAINQQIDGLDPISDAQTIASLTKQVQELQKQVTILKGAIQQIEKALTLQGISISQLDSTISTIQNAIKTVEKQLQEKQEEINKAKKTLESQEKTFKKTKSTSYAQLEEGKRKLEIVEKQIKDNEKKLEEAKKEAESKIQEAKEELEEASLKLADIKKPEWYILDRQQNTGYVSYMQDTDRIANLASVFPVVFFVVAALISLTSMSRMVEEQRVQIGTLKALGYTKMQIASKYIIYALLATIVGSGIGLLIGFNILPKIITTMYAMMYTVPDVVLEFNMQYALIGTLAALACTVGATIYSATKELIHTPANLMRPKAPKPGKRVFIERIPFLWSKLNFTKKVTARNIFRYKKRFLMTIIGVMGCTALILAGFGLRDAIAKMIPSQYGEIFQYNIQVSLKDNLTKKQIQEEKDKLLSLQEIKNILKVEIQSIEIEEKDSSQNIQLMIPEKTSSLSDFITLKSRTQKDKIYELDEKGVVLTEKLAKLLNIKEGDDIKLKNIDDQIVEVKVSHITENYLMHYIYMSPKLYEELYGTQIKGNTLLINTEKLLQEQENRLGEKILEDKETISAITFTSNTENIFSEVMDNMNFVVWILIISAGLLAFVVLYNLANTNISERIRELATIKVLGFYDKEVYDYVARETVILTIIGMILGLIAGYFLTMFIITTCELDILMFDKRINFISFIYAILITIFFAAIVNITTYFALKKINMIESLKSVE